MKISFVLLPFVAPAVVKKRRDVEFDGLSLEGDEIDGEGADFGAQSGHFGILDLEDVAVIDASLNTGVDGGFGDLGLTFIHDSGLGDGLYTGLVHES